MSDRLGEYTSTHSTPVPGTMGQSRFPHQAYAQPIKAKGGLSRRQERQATAFLTQNLGDAITVGDIAAECGLSPSHFSRAFRETTGQTPHRWLIERRVAKAKELLLTSDLAIVDIAADCGFADQSHLTRRFTDMAGLPPGTWRRHHQR